MIIRFTNLRTAPTSLPGPLPRLKVNDKNITVDINPEEWDRYKEDIATLIEAGAIMMEDIEMVGSFRGKYTLHDDRMAIDHETIQIAPSTGGPDAGKVKVSSNDITLDFLLSKLAAGMGISLSELNDGGNEQLEISSSGGVFGTEYVDVQDTVVSTTTSTTFQPKTQLVTSGSIPAGRYKFEVSYMWNHNATSNDFEAQVVQNGSTQIYFHKQEPKDSSGLFGATGTSQRYVATKILYLDLAAGAYSFDLEFRTDRGGVASSIWDTNMSLFRVG